MREPKCSKQLLEVTHMTTPSGAEEVEVEPILRSFDRMKIHGESEPKPRRGLTTPQATTGSHDQFSPEPFLSNPVKTPQHPQRMDTRNRDDRAGSDTHTSKPPSYTEKISSATAVVADKAISAKNVVASKLGYGGETREDQKAHAHGSGDGTAAKPSSSAAEYGKKIAATVTEKLTPVYERVAGAGSAAMSKMQGTGAGNEPAESINDRGRGQDRGISVKDYFAERLRPGEEDRALSEVISEAIHKRNLNPEEEADDQLRPVGKVRQSEEVTRRLGPMDGKAEKEREQTVLNRPEEEGGGGYGKGVVDKVKGAVGSLFGFGGGEQSSQTSQRPVASSDVGGEQGYSAASADGGTEHHIDNRNERRLQESGN